MFSRRGLLSALAGAIPGLWLLKPKESKSCHALSRRSEILTMLGDSHYCVEDTNGTKKYYFCHLLHRTDGPAIEFCNGNREWLIYGEHHREDGPAIICEKDQHGKGKIEFWCKNDQYHRLDGPAVIDANGRREWWVDGKKHRIDGPAIETDYLQQWWVDGKCHRLNGPAIVRIDGAEYEEWWENGKHLKTIDKGEILVRHTTHYCGLGHNKKNFELLHSMRRS